MVPAYPPPPSAWKRWFQFAAGGSQTSIWIWGATVICTRQNATGTGGPGGKPGNGGGGENVFAAIDVAAIEVTSGSWRFAKLLQVSARAGVANNAAATARTPPPTIWRYTGGRIIWFLPPLVR